MYVYIAVAEYFNTGDFSILGAFISRDDAACIIKEDKESNPGRLCKPVYEIIETPLELRH